jgi:hypothetical protein
VKGSGHGLFKGTIPSFAWRDWGKPQKPLLRIASAPAEIQVGQHLKCNSEDLFYTVLISSETEQKLTYF